LSTRAFLFLLGYQPQNADPLADHEIGRPSRGGFAAKCRNDLSLQSMASISDMRWPVQSASAAACGQNPQFLARPRPQALGFEDWVTERGSIVHALLRHHLRRSPRWPCWGKALAKQRRRPPRARPVPVTAAVQAAAVNMKATQRAPASRHADRRSFHKIVTFFKRAVCVAWCCGPRSERC